MAVVGARNVRHLLLYGTLGTGEPAHAALGLPGVLELLGPRIVAGTLYDLGEYPGIVLGRGATWAELYRILDAALLGRLDAYEGFAAHDPQGSLFVRTAVRVRRFAHAPAPRVTAWIYVFNGAGHGRPAIIGGSWREHRRAHAGARLERR